MLHALILAAAALAAGAQDAKPAERARANLGSYFSTDDYPAMAVRRGAEGTVRFELEIAPEGHVNKCDVTSSSGDAALDAATCSILLGRASYTPARDAAGRAIPGSDRGSVTWRLPPPEPQAFASVRAPVRINLTIGTDAAGRPICSVLLNGGSAGADKDAICAVLAGSDGSDLAQHLPANAVINIDVAIALDGEHLAPANVDRGERMMTASARLTIGPDGRVIDCNMVETNLREGLGIIGDGMPELCTFPGFEEAMFSEIPPGSAPRSGSLRMEIYLRRGGPRTT